MAVGTRSGITSSDRMTGTHPYRTSIPHVSACPQIIHPDGSAHMVQFYEDDAFIVRSTISAVMTGAGE